MGADNVLNNIDMRALFSMTYGMYVICTEFSGKKNGQIANTVMQITGEPINISVCLNKANYTAELIQKSGVFTVSILGQEVPMTFIGLFGFKCGRDIDKFVGVNFQTAATGAPLVTDWAIAAMEARVKDTVELPTHVLFIGELVVARYLKEAAPLTYSDYHKIKKGKSPKTAPTFGFNELK